jgi:S-DNA-T family DNA segregation ATPase FtsK/SpoIIIE
MNKSKPSDKQKKSLSNISDLKEFFASNATRFVIGLIILVIAIYASIAMASFLFTGAADQSKIEGVSFFHWGSVDGITNWTGMRGAILSNWLMNKGFGISTFFLLLFVAFVGLRLMKARYVNLLRYFITCSILTIWTSVTLSFLFGSFFRDTAYYIGGAHGYYLSELMNKNFGVPGTILIILVVLILILVLISSRTVPFIQNLTKKGVPEKVDPVPVKNGRSVSLFQFIKRLFNKDIPSPVKPERSATEVTPVIKVPEVKPVDTVTEKPDPGFKINVPKDDDEIFPVNTPFNNTNKKVEDIDDSNLGPYDPTLDLSFYQKPPIDLLERYDQGKPEVDYS